MMALKTFSRIFDLIKVLDECANQDAAGCAESQDNALTGCVENRKPYQYTDVQAPFSIVTIFYESLLRLGLPRSVVFSP